MPGYIKPAGIEKAKVCLDDARATLKNCAEATDYTIFAKQWRQFLIAAVSVIHVLENASFASPQGRQWFGTTKRAGRADELALYMYQARNAEEHGIDPVTELRSGGVGIGAPGEKIHIKSLVIRGGKVDLELGEEHKGPVTIEVIPAHVELRTVVDDRFKQSFDPPKQHKGKPIECDAPDAALTIARLYVDYLAEMIADAERLA